jgi:hypothetical protein
MNHIEKYRTIRNYEELYEHDKWKYEMPYLLFPADWQVAVVPPFGGALIRFYVKRGNGFVSAYLDCYDRLGYVGEPYWEIHPYDEDVFRCMMGETDKLIEAISQSLDEQEATP